MKLRPLRLPLLAAALAPLAPAAALTVEDLGTSYEPQNTAPGLFHDPPEAELTPGNTSIRRLGRERAIWKGGNSRNGTGYYRRDRDLGQVFTVPEDLDGPVRVDALVLRTGIGSRAVGPIAGAPVHIQFFEVTEGPEGLAIHDNHTPVGTEATHGWDTSFNRADDLVTGVAYHPMEPTAPAPLPDLQDTARSAYDREAGEIRDPEPGHLRYLRFDLEGDEEPELRPGGRYAFMLGFTEPGADRHLALANDGIVRGVTIYDTDNPPSLVPDANGHPTWGIRREGNGAMPPKMMGSLQPPPPGPEREAMLDDAAFADDHAMTLSPGSEGYPDVDTYRVFVFTLELAEAGGTEEAGDAGGER